MPIIRWVPFRELAGLESRMSRLQGESSRGVGPGAEAEGARGAWSPAVDIYEKDGTIVLKAELPGIEAKDVDVSVENNVLTLRGERRFEHEVEKQSYQRVERAYGAFTRSFTLPTVVDTDKIKADFKDGVLSMTLPTKEEAKPKQITIAVTR